MRRTAFSPSSEAIDTRQREFRFLMLAFLPRALHQTFGQKMYSYVQLYICVVARYIPLYPKM